LPVILDEEWAEWQFWLSDDPKTGIYEDIVAMMASRQTWDAFNRVYGQARERARRSGIFQSWLATNYVQFQAMAIRRQTDLRTDVISLARLIQRVATTPKALSRDRYLAIPANAAVPKLSNVHFDELVGEGRDEIDPAVPKADLYLLRKKSEPIREFVNKTIAHYDKEKARFHVDLNYGDLHKTVDLAIDLSVKYRQMILGVTMAKEVVVPPWLGIFRVPWIKDDHTLYQIVGELDAEIRQRSGMT
jgi:hypothetical protein